MKPQPAPIPDPTPIDYEAAEAVLAGDDKPSLTARVGRGVAWGVLGTIAVKIVGFVAQMLLAKILLKKDFSLIALALTVAMFISLIREAGIGQILISRGKEFDRWANGAFWMSLTLSVIAGVALVIVAPFAARFYGRPELTGMLWALALASPLTGLGTVPAAKINVDMRFGFLAVATLGISTFTYAGNVLLAWRGFGPYSFIWPTVAAAAVRTAVLWWAARPPVRFTPDFHTWRRLMTASGWLLGTAALTTLIQQCDNMMLGYYRNDTVVANYFFALGLSVQTAGLISTAVAVALLPAFAQLRDDPPRQLAAFFRGCRPIVFCATPLCFMQALAAGPLLTALFGDKWTGAIVPLEILSIGTAGAVLGSPSLSLIQARDRYRAYFFFVIVSAVFLTLSIRGALFFGDAVAVAIAVATYYWVFGLAGILFAADPTIGGFKRVAPVIFRPLLIAAACGLLARRVPVPPSQIVTMLVQLSVFAALYLAAAAVFMRDDLLTLTGQGMMVLRKFAR